MKILTRLPRNLGERARAWQLVPVCRRTGKRELARKVYRLTKKPVFAKDYGLKKQIQDAGGSSMHNIAKGFDFETNYEEIKATNREPDNLSSYK